MYSPTAIESAPATRPASPAVTRAAREEFAAATPMTSPATERMPSLAPSTAARSHPARWLLCASATCAATDTERTLPPLGRGPFPGLACARPARRHPVV